MPSQLSTNEPGRTELGGYWLVARLGEGGMGEVWRGERDGPGGVRRRVAIKRILAGRHKDPVLRERFLNEARTHARLEHPNVVRMLDFGDQPELYLVFEFVLGGSVAAVLAELAKRRATMPPAAAAYVAAEVASALDYVHRVTDDQGKPLRIVHRDISPQNVLLSTEGAVKLGDFGVVRVADSSFQTQAGMSVGKLVYMAPEQVLGRAFDHRADVFALGITLWEMLTVRALLPRDDTARAVALLQSGRFEVPSRYNPQVPPALDAIVMRALALDPNQRFTSAEEMGQQLRAAVHAIAPGIGSREIAKMLHDALPGRLAMPPAVALPTSGRTIPPPGSGMSGAPLHATDSHRDRPGRVSIPQVPMRKGRTALMVTLLATIAIAIGVGAFFLFGRKEPAGPTNTAVVPAITGQVPVSPKPSITADAGPVPNTTLPLAMVPDVGAGAPGVATTTDAATGQDATTSLSVALDASVDVEQETPQAAVADSGALLTASMDVSDDAGRRAAPRTVHRVSLPTLTSDESAQLEAALRKMRGRVRACLSLEEDSGVAVNLTLGLSDGRARLDSLTVSRGAQPSGDQSQCMRSLVESTLAPPETSRRVPFRHRYQF